VLRLPDHWLWDSWIAVDGGLFHLFFLRASRALQDPDRRHLRAAIGHAISSDLRSWELLPDALVHADGPAWDDQALWTGSVVRGPDRRWYLFYTGISRAGRASDQRIGVATSADLVTWHRVGAEPLLGVDPRWYECLDGEPPTSAAWRDPFVFPDPAGDGWHMLITARARTGPAGGRGVVGHARAHDLLRWRARPPLSAPAGFGHLEVPQAQVVDGRPVLIFSCQPDRLIGPRPAGPATAGTWTVPGDSVVGPWDVASAVPFRHPSLYGARLVQDRDGGWCLVGFRDTEHGVFYGECLDPIPVAHVDGRLVAADRPRQGDRRAPVS
jgi:beta-fructofuranosidase